MNNTKINTLNNTEIELTENDLEEVNGGLLCELAVAGAVVGAAAIGTAAVVGTAALASACRPRPTYYSYEYEYVYCRETGYRW